MKNKVMTGIFAIGLTAVAWVGWGFVGTSPLALAMTVVIAAVYVLGARELRQYRAATASLATALAEVAQAPADLGAWLGRLHPSLQNPVRQRIEGERVPLPGPALTPYLVGLLVMLGMLGTFLGMVVTFKGAVFALEGSSNLEAIRAALAAPIKGLSLSFGTSVAGVAASAMLGLLAAMSRRERLEVARQLDGCLAGVLRPFSAAHQRQEVFQALQVQAQAMPLIAERLQELAQGLEQRHLQLNEQLLARQQAFHHEASAAYSGLASAVGASLQDSLCASARLAGDTIRPVVEQTMAGIAQEARLSQQRLTEATHALQQGLAAQWEGTARQVADTWTAALQGQQQTQGALVADLDRILLSFTQTFEQRALALQGELRESAGQAHAAQQRAEQQRLEDWNRAMAAMAGTLAAEWQRVGAQTLGQQQEVCRALESAAGQITQRVNQQVEQTLGGTARLLTQSQELIDTRRQAEAAWVQEQGQRMSQLTEVWRTELMALRDQEAVRGQAAVERLDALQAAVAGHLATLGAALEAPLTRLLQTASDVPRAAAEVIAQLRQEMTRLSERDNLALAERGAMLEQMGALLNALHDAGAQQRAAIESLVDSAASVLAQAGRQFDAVLTAQAGKAEEVATHVAASAVELSSLGEAFSHGVSLFNAGNEKLMESLRRIEGAIGQSMTRSDEQLAYYVAQAREVIDLSITSQQGLLEDLRRLHGQAAGQGAAG